MYEEYDVDRDIPEKIWNNYLKKYKGIYRLFMGGDRIWRILCKWGHIEPYSLKKGYLCFYGDFGTSQKKTYFLKKKPQNVELVQMGYSECVLRFLEPNLPFLSMFFETRNKRHVSDERKQKLVEQLKKAREAKKF